MSRPSDTKGYTIVGAQPVIIPATGASGWEDNSNVKGDSARYTLKPDDEFARPWLAIPGSPGICFVWPVGTEGFDFTIAPTLGTHKYLGDNRVDVQVIHTGEETMVLSGTFPGQTSVENMNALRDVILRETPERGKILHLPLVLPKYQYVVVQTSNFSHAEGDMYQDIHYSITFTKVGTGKSAQTKAPTTARQNPTISVVQKSARGNASKVYVTNDKINSLRKIAVALGRPSSGWSVLYDKNKAPFTKTSVPPFQVPDYRLPPGTKIYY